jgi:hypothetical protein
LLITHPDECIIGILVAATGLPFYFWFKTTGADKT